jgi:LEA14-like dessication related protein
MTRIPMRLEILGVRSALVIVSLSTLFQGCALFYRAPAVEIVDIEILSLGLSSGTAEVVLDVTNEGRRQMEIRGFLYEIEVKDPREDGGWASLAEGFFPQELSIPGSETRRVAVPVPFQYAALGAAVRSFLSEGEVPYRLKGEVWIGGDGLGLQIPFRDQGVLKP